MRTAEQQQRLERLGGLTVLSRADERHDDLRVEHDVVVALVGLAPVYSHGLRLGLSSAGITCTVLESPSELPALLDASPVVVVLPHDQSATLAGLRQQPQQQPRQVDLRERRQIDLRQPAPQQRPQRGRWRIEAVHVLSDGSARSFSEALHSGATGAFQDTAELEEIVRTVRCAALGYVVLPVTVARALSRHRNGTAPQVSAQERTYLRLLANGATVAGLARRSGYSEREMYRLLSGLYGRLGARNRTEALLVAQRWELLDEEAR